jgi:hypothetical protein
VFEIAPRNKMREGLDEPTDELHSTTRIVEMEVSGEK